jgi:ABC-type glycerol-3-phosphate transport system substrate-binding protein
MNRIIVVALTIVLALTLSACGSEATDSAAQADSSETEALQERIEELEAENRREERQAKREQRRRARQAAVAEPKEEPAASSGGGGDIIVPDVTGLDHQAAQDALQGEGLWLLAEEDATGQGRLLLWDRNWEVVRTDPPAGTAVSEDTTITIYSKKQGE